jgi:hypothetical protein
MVVVCGKAAGLRHTRDFCRRGELFGVFGGDSGILGFWAEDSRRVWLVRSGGPEKEVR